MFVRRQRILTTVAIAVVLCSARATLVAVSDQPDFSGTWFLNESKSDSPPQFGGGGRGGRRGPGGPGGRGGSGRGGPGGGRGVGGRDGRGGGRGGPGGALPYELGVKEEDGEIHVFPIGKNGEDLHAFTFQPGAGPQEVSTPRGLATVEARWEGSELVVDEIRERESPRGTMTIEQEQRWTLSGDGKTLTQVIRTSTPMGEREMRRVFDKE